MNETKTISSLVRQMEQDDRLGKTTSSRYVTTSMRDDIDTTEAYLNSKHISGPTDYLGREKPFFNIVMAARNIWFRATDIDRKNIVIRATKASDEIKAFMATLLLQQWMKKQQFGKFLNDWGLALATHGSAVSKFIEKDGELHAQVMDWNEILVDPVDFENNIKVEKLYFTPAQLQRQEGYDKEIVARLLENLTTRKTMDGQSKDNKSEYILIYEVHGEMPLSFLTGEEKDEDTYVQQMHVINFQESNYKKDTFEEYTLYSGKEAKDPYMITHLIKKDGMTYSGGAVKNLFEAQWMVNHTQKMIKDQLDLASKIIFQTSDGNFVGQNVLTNIENGNILIHTPNNPLTQIANHPDIAAMQAFQGAWQQNANQINNISESMMGQNAPSGTAWRQVQALLQESHSLFELMTENKGLAIIDMMTEYILPSFRKTLNNADEISMVLEDYQIKQIDNRYIPAEATRRLNRIKKDTILRGEIYDPTQEPIDLAQATQQIQDDLKGNQRFIRPAAFEDTTWKEVFKDFEWDLDIDVTGEAHDTQAAMATLTTVLQTISQNPAVLQDSNVKMVFGKILQLAGGISPIEIQANQPAQQPQVPQPALVGAPAGAPAPQQAT